MNTEKMHKCWSCDNVYNGCSYAKDDIPVENWVAKISVRQGVGKSFTVLECPEYKYDGQCTKCFFCMDKTKDNKPFCPHVVYNKEGECKVAK
jgi:hypothetical protein